MSVTHQQKWLVLSISFLISSSCTAQLFEGKKAFTHQDTLRGTITPERAWWDVMQYSIFVKPEYSSKTISGYSQISFKTLKRGRKMQVDLQQPLIIDSITERRPVIGKRGEAPYRDYSHPFTRDGNAYFVDLEDDLPDGHDYTIKVYYHGKPREAKNPPWDGGWIWTKDKEGRTWMSVACQGLGASVWYPCKDHQSDEPDKGAVLSIVVPDTLVAVGNGRMTNKLENGDGTTTYTWQVVNPINNYDIIPYIGKYVTWHVDYPGEKGKLDCNYWVLDYDLEKAKAHFKQADTMLKCFEHWFGPYPFYEDGYKLVEAPHLGMEHQSAVAYGNGFMQGYLGRDLSRSGWGTKWDFIIVHESAHEWFGNNITTNDLADMWIHEGFANYAETIYTTCLFGIEAGNDYCIGSRRNTQNDVPIIGPYGVNKEGSGDMYYKGGNLLHMIRQIINDDEKFRQILRGLTSTFYHKTVDSKEVEAYISKNAGKDFSKVFDQYLRTTQIPELEYKMSGNDLSVRWTNCVNGFNMPVKIKWNGVDRWISPTESWVTLTGSTAAEGELQVDRNFYVKVKRGT